MKDKDEAVAALSRYFPEFKSCVVNGFADYPAKYKEVSYQHHPRSRASIIHDHIVAHAQQLFTKFKDIQKIPTKLRSLFEVNNLCVIQFKKFKRNLRTSNIQTAFSKSFDSQRPLPGILPTLPRISLGYIPKPDWTDVAGVYLTCSAGKRLIWYVDLTHASSDTATLPLEFPETTHATPLKRIRAKSHRRKQGGDAAASI